MFTPMLTNMYILNDTSFDQFVYNLPWGSNSNSCSNRSTKACVLANALLLYVNVGTTNVTSHTLHCILVCVLLLAQWNQREQETIFGCAAMSSYFTTSAWSWHGAFQTFVPQLQTFNLKQIWYTDVQIQVKCMKWREFRLLANRLKRLYVADNRTQGVWICKRSTSSDFGKQTMTLKRFEVRPSIQTHAVIGCRLSN